MGSCEDVGKRKRPFPQGYLLLTIKGTSHVSYKPITEHSWFGNAAVDQFNIF